jgi:hypothetical protein
LKTTHTNLGALLQDPLYFFTFCEAETQRYIGQLVRVDRQFLNDLSRYVPTQFAIESRQVSSPTAIQNDYLIICDVQPKHLADLMADSIGKFDQIVNDRSWINKESL